MRHCVNMGDFNAERLKTWVPLSRLGRPLGVNIFATKDIVELRKEFSHHMSHEPAYFSKILFFEQPYRGVSKIAREAMKSLVHLVSASVCRAPGEVVLRRASYASSEKWSHHEYLPSAPQSNNPVRWILTQTKYFEQALIWYPI